jgi:hypothetical protein
MITKLLAILNSFVFCVPSRRFDLACFFLGDFDACRLSCRKVEQASLSALSQQAYFLFVTFGEEIACQFACSSTLE